MSVRVRDYLPPVLWVAVIFIFSTSSFSDRSTLSFLEGVLTRLCPSCSHEHIGLLNYLVRKCAHLFEYAVLAALWLRAFLKSGFDFRKAVYFTLAVSLACASADEYHQSFLSMRSAKASDVALDIVASALSLSMINLGIKKRRTEAASGKYM